MKLHLHISSARRLLLAGVLATVLSAELAAQTAQTVAPRALNSTAQSVPGLPAVSSITSDLALNYSFSPKSDLERGSKIGDAELSQFGFNYLLSAPLRRDRMLIVGISGTFTDLELTGSSPLPDKLQQVGLTLGVRKNLSNWFGPRWSATAMIRPNITSDSTSLSGDGFSIPASLTFGFKQSPTLSWDFGLNVNPESDSVVLPILGARWDFAPDWTATFGFPQTGIAYKISSDLTLQGGVRLQGGTYYIAETRAPGLGDTWMDYREIRAGIGFDYKLTKQISVGADAGAVLYRHFDYLDRDYEVDGGSAGYFAVSLRARF